MSDNVTPVRKLIAHLEKSKLKGRHVMTTKEILRLLYHTSSTERRFAEECYETGRQYGTNQTNEDFDNFYTKFETK